MQVPTFELAWSAGHTWTWIDPNHWSEFHSYNDKKIDFVSQQVRSIQVKEYTSLTVNGYAQNQSLETNVKMENIIVTGVHM